MITDDNRRGYAGEDYEKVLIRAFLAISNLMTDGGDAGAYALQVADKQQQIIEAGVDKEGENPKLAYQHVAVGAYIHGLLREANALELRRRRPRLGASFAVGSPISPSASKTCSAQPRPPFGARQRRAVCLRTGRPRALQGETVEMPSTAALLVADRILSATATSTRCRRPSRRSKSPR